MLKASISLVQQRWGKLDRRKHSTRSIHIYEIRPRVDNAVGYAKSYSRLHPVVIRVYDATRNVIETLEYKHDLKRAVSERNKKPPCSEA